MNELNNDQIKKFIKTGKIKIGDCEVVTDMLKINKKFRDAVVNDHHWGQKSSDKGRANVMLSLDITPELMALGRSREVTNRIQRLRKTSGISIED